MLLLIDIEAVWILGGDGEASVSYLHLFVPAKIHTCKFDSSDIWDLSGYLERVTTEECISKKVDVYPHR